MEKVFMAICHDFDPETGENKETVLGVFTTFHRAASSFSDIVHLEDKFASADFRHTCYRGAHNVVMLELNKLVLLGHDLHGDIVDVSESKANGWR